jgi:hypothetical protein
MNSGVKLKSAMGFSVSPRIFMAELVRITQIDWKILNCRLDFCQDVFQLRQTASVTLDMIM